MHEKVRVNDMVEEAHTIQRSLHRLDQMLKDKEKILLERKMKEAHEFHTNATKHAEKVYHDSSSLEEQADMYQEKKILKIEAAAKKRTRNVQLEKERSAGGGKDTIQYTEMGERRRDLLLTPALIKFPAATRETGRKKNPDSTERKLNFLLIGTTMQRLTDTTLNDSNQQHQETRRHVCLSKDFERIEVHRTTAFGSEAAAVAAVFKRETFFRTDRISSVQRNKKKCAFSLLFKNSNTKIFYPENQNQLEMWTSSLQLLLYHAKDQGGLARLRHKMNTK